MRFPGRILSLSALLASCTTVRAVQPAELSPPHTPARVWVTRSDQSTVVFDSAQIHGGVLVGLVNGAPENLPVSETTVLRAREHSEARTAAVVLGVTAAAAGAVMYLAFTQPGSPGPSVCQADCPSGDPKCCGPVPL